MSRNNWGNKETQKYEYESDYSYDGSDKIDNLIEQEEVEHYQNTLKNLGLTEKMGVNGQVMLYPIKTKQKRWHQNDYMAMVNRLYTVKNDTEKMNSSRNGKRSSEMSKSPPTSRRSPIDKKGNANGGLARAKSSMYLNTPSTSRLGNIGAGVRNNQRSRLNK